ncbi:MAG: N-acetyltransferase family protein [Solirubrobacterales bacterium]
MEIGAAKHDEVEQIVPLMLAYCDFYEVEHPDEARLTEMARALIDAPDDEGILLAARDGDAVAGFAACGWKWSSLRGARIVVLEDLFVAPDHRGEGIADELIGACAEIARRHGAPVLAWYTQPTNKRARAVYDRVGGTHEELLEYELDLGGT